MYKRQYLDSKQQTYPLEHPVLILFQWDTKNDIALVLIRVQGALKIVEYNLDNMELNEAADQKALWALKSDDGRFIYKDRLKQFWQPGPVEPQLIKPLKQQGGKAKSFVINGNTIYDINDANQLWSFDLNTQTFQVIGKVTDAVDNLSDINQEQLLMTIQVSAKKEVVELTTSE